MDFTEKLVWQPAPFQSWGEKTDWIQEVRPEMPPFTFFHHFSVSQLPGGTQVNHNFRKRHL
jgi:hypothetical protein